MKIYLIHGGELTPKDCWYPWLIKELSEKNYKIIAPEMPNNRNIDTWINTLKDKIKADEKTILIGHSRGCQAILRFLEITNQKFHKIILIAPYLTLELNDQRGQEIKKWLDRPIIWKKIKNKSEKFITFFSTNDHIVNLEDSNKLKKELNAQVIIKENWGHFDDVTNVKEIPFILDEIK
jgi:hypothetical protein